MKFPYKVEYLNSPRTKDKGYSPVDGLAFAKDLEALLLEYSNVGYELFETHGINNLIAGTASDTAGMIVIFKKKEDKLNDQ